MPGLRLPGIGTVVDVGGATGNIRGAADAAAQLHGILFGLPRVVGAAPALLQERGVDTQVRIGRAASSKACPPAQLRPAVTQHSRLERWRCLRFSGTAGARWERRRVLIIERYCPGDTRTGQAADLVMLLFPGGQERTARGRRAVREGRFPIGADRSNELCCASSRPCLLSGMVRSRLIGELD